MNRKLLTLMTTGIIVILITTLITTEVIFMPSPTQAQETISQPPEMLTRQKRGEEVFNSLTDGQGFPPQFQQLQKDFPELADLTLKYALGNIWGREVLNPKTRQLVALAGFAAQSTMPQFKLHAQYALNYGVTPEELMEVVYIITATSGFPRAMIAAATLKELFQENKVNFPITSQR
jgi:4-carboxymuconolactone decarboxylase